MKKIFKCIFSFITVFILFIAIFLIGVRIFGITPYAIISTSMAPSYNQGDIVYTKEVEAIDLKKGDVITFKAKDSILVTHRIDKVDLYEGLIYTKGDNNPQRDLVPIEYDAVLGKVIFKIPLLGYVSTFFMTANGKYVYFGLIIVLLILLFIPGGKKNNGE